MWLFWKLIYILNRRIPETGYMILLWCLQSFEMKSLVCWAAILSNSPQLSDCANSDGKNSILAGGQGETTIERFLTPGAVKSHRGQTDNVPPQLGPVTLRGKMQGYSGQTKLTSHFSHFLLYTCLLSSGINSIWYIQRHEIYITGWICKPCI